MEVISRGGYLLYAPCRPSPVTIVFVCMHLSCQAHYPALVIVLIFIFVVGDGVAILLPEHPSLRPSLLPTLLPLLLLLLLQLQLLLPLASLPTLQTLPKTLRPATSDVLKYIMRPMGVFMRRVRHSSYNIYMRTCL